MRWADITHLPTVNYYINLSRLNIVYILHKQYISSGKYVVQDRDTFNSIVSSMIQIGGLFGSIFGGITVFDIV